MTPLQYCGGLFIKQFQIYNSKINQRSSIVIYTKIQNYPFITITVFNPSKPKIQSYDKR